jgi:hypothetical protein
MPQTTLSGTAPALAVSVSDATALEAARAAKYREIRDAELDYRTGKLSRADYETVDTTLRQEALAILDRLEPVAAQVGQPEPATPESEKPEPEERREPEEPEPEDRVLART